MKTINKLTGLAAVILLLVLMSWDAAVLRYKHWRNPHAPIWLED